MIVRYHPPSPSEYDWVYNSANIDEAHIVWARDMGASANAELLAYFNTRQAWLMEPDENPPRLSPYSPRPPAPTRRE